MSTHHNSSWIRLHVAGMAPYTRNGTGGVQDVGHLKNFVFRIIDAFPQQEILVPTVGWQRDAQIHEFHECHARSRFGRSIQRQKTQRCGIDCGEWHRFRRPCSWSTLRWLWYPSKAHGSYGDKDNNWANQTNHEVQAQRDIQVILAMVSIILLVLPTFKIHFQPLILNFGRLGLCKRGW